jgi:hypothetical protein
MCSTNDLIFFRKHNPTQFKYEPKDWKYVEQIAEEATRSAAQYIQTDSRLEMNINDNRCHPQYDDEKNLRIATRVCHLLYARHLYLTNGVGVKKNEPDSDVFSLKYPVYEWKSTKNDDQLQHLVRFWMSTYLIRETTAFKKKWEVLDYILKYSYATNLFESIWNNFWVYVNHIIFDIYQTNPALYNDVNIYEKNIHPFDWEEFKGMCIKLGGGSQVLANLPSCTWVTQGGMDAGCDTQKGFSGIMSNGQKNIYARKPCERWNLKSSEIVGEGSKKKRKRNYQNRINIQRLFYRMIVGPIEYKNRLMKNPNIPNPCRKSDITRVCFNPHCFHQVKRTNDNKEDFEVVWKKFKEGHPGIEAWVKG